MKNFTISPNKKESVKVWAIAFWLLLWQGLSMHIGREVLLTSPFLVLRRLLELSMEFAFWSAVLFSMGRIVIGFSFATVVGVLLAGISSRFKVVEQLLEPAMLFVKATPIASIIVLLLLWFSSRNLAVIVSFLMVLPIMYTNVLGGIKNIDKSLLEMAAVFDMSIGRRIKYIYFWEVLPFFKAACLLGLGLSWKAGVAAEIIGIPTGSIGAHLHRARIFLDTPSLFAWTIAVIVLSTTFERLFMLTLDHITLKMEGM